MKAARWFRDRALGPLLAGAAGVTACVLQTVIFGVPVPGVHDEYSYLLAADTFRHGRCANLPHRFWQHFETIHVLQQPTYASKYPPGQGLFLAAGWRLGGHPIVGVWLGMGLACAGTTWMLRAFVPKWWAVVGGLLMASRLGFSEWGYCYMGGGVAAAGGGLFLGGWARVLRRPRWFPATVMAIGLTLLAVSRPFEGLLLCVPVGVASLVWLVRTRPPARTVVRQVLVPALAVLLPAAIALGHYNHQVTGSTFRLPYMEHTAQYDAAPVLLIQDPYPIPRYRHDAIRDFHLDFELGNYLIRRTFRGWCTQIRDKLFLWWEDYFGYGLTLSLFALPWVLRESPRTRFALAACGFVLAAVAALETWGLTHYTAPVSGLVYLAVVQGFRRLSLLGGQWPVGRRFVGLWLSVCLVLPVFNLLATVWDPILERVAPVLPDPVVHDLQRWLLRKMPLATAVGRSELLQTLRTAGGRHLILVHYGPGHSYHEELVYNEAEIDSAQVVWAREMTPDRQARLLDYFKDRTVWRLDIDQEKADLSPVRGPISARGLPTVPRPIVKPSG